jgi:hypothetical protein
VPELPELAAGELSASIRSSRNACRSLSTAAGEVAPEAPEAAVEVEVPDAVALLALLPEAAAPEAGVRPIWLNAWNIASTRAVRPLAWLPAVEAAPLPSLSPSLSVADTVAAVPDAFVDAVEAYRLEVETLSAGAFWTVLPPELPLRPCGA